MGFEIGNHSWTHADFSVPRNAARLAGELALVENELKKVNVPKPVSFAYSGNSFGPEAIRVLNECGYRLARRGGSPEVEYGTLQVGPVFDPRRHDPLLIPTTGDAYPKWTLEHFLQVVSEAKNGQAVVLQFHGVPDVKHPWVHTPPESFKQYMLFLKKQRYNVIALRDLERYIDFANPPSDPLLRTRYKRAELIRPPFRSRWPLRARIRAIGWRTCLARTGTPLPKRRRCWAGTMLRSPLRPNRLRRSLFRNPRSRYGLTPAADRCESASGKEQSILCVGRRRVCSCRGRPANTSWWICRKRSSAISAYCSLHILTSRRSGTNRNKVIDNIDWERLPSGGLRSSWRLPDTASFGASIIPERDEVKMEIWLRNESAQASTRLRTQICVLLKGAASFNAQTNENKIFGKTAAAVQSAAGNRWIATEWERCGRTWGNAQCPCLHSDPVLPDCPPGQTVKVSGRLWFAEGEQPINRAL